jgi:hypothetical protein
MDPGAAVRSQKCTGLLHLSPADYCRAQRPGSATSGGATSVAPTPTCETKR